MTGLPSGASAPVVTTYLEMTAPSQLRPATRPVDPSARVVRTQSSWSLSRALWTEVGRDWSWTSRAGWDAARWRTWAERDGVETWLVLERDTPAGYAELELQGGGEVELVSLGLLRGFEGRGLGGLLVTRAVRRAWEMGDPTRRVWVHTCTLDSPAALPGYRARGFTVFDVRAWP